MEWMILQIRNPEVIDQQTTGRYLPVLITVLEANGFPACRSLKVLKELNGPQGTEAEEIAPFTSLLLELVIVFSTFS